MLENGTKYKWSNDAVIPLNSEQFSILYGSLAAIVSSPSFQEKIIEAQQTFAIVNCQSIMNEIMTMAVESGIATKDTDEEDNQE